MRPSIRSLMKAYLNGRAIGSRLGISLSRRPNMPRPPRADEAGGLYHALNRGNLRAAIFHKDAMGHVYQQRYKSFPIQYDEHFFVVCRYVERNALRARLVRRAEDWRWGSLWRWLQKPEPNPSLLSPWPMSRLPGWVDRVDCSPPQAGIHHTSTRPQTRSIPQKA